MKYKILIAEDERLAREELAYQLQLENDFIICPSAENGRQFLDFYKKYKPDIVFIDIQMPKMSGMDAVEIITRENKATQRSHPYVVFITAYEEYALQAFGVGAVDYLLKPYGQDHLKETIIRLRKQLSQPASNPTKLLIEDHEKVVVIQPDEILYACRNDRFIDIYTKDNQIQTKMTLNELEERLEGFRFFRPHRSYLVNLDAIQEIVPWFNGAYNLILKYNQAKIPVSRSISKALFERLKE